MKRWTHNLKLNQLQEARYMSTTFIDLVNELLKSPDNILHSRLIDIDAVPEAVSQLTRAFGEPHINYNGIKYDHGAKNTKLPRIEQEDSNSFVAYSWEDVPARYVALDVFTDGRHETAEIFVDKRYHK